MVHEKLLICSLLFLILGRAELNAQESMNTIGGDASGSGGSVSYSVGQMATQTSFNTNYSIAEGVQQPFEISIITEINEAQGITLSIYAYPNPTSDYLNLTLDIETLNDFSYQLFDMNQKLLHTEKILNKQTKINMHDLSNATYYLQVKQKNTKVKIFKIIKK